MSQIFISSRCHKSFKLFEFPRGDNAPPVFSVKSFQLINVLKDFGFSILKTFQRPVGNQHVNRFVSCFGACWSNGSLIALSNKHHCSEAAFRPAKKQSKRLLCSFSRFLCRQLVNGKIPHVGLKEQAPRPLNLSGFHAGQPF